MDRRIYLALLLFAATGLTIWAFGLILSPFLVPIGWAMCLATVTGGLYKRLERWTKKPRFAAFVMTLGTALAVVLPLVVFGSLVVEFFEGVESHLCAAQKLEPVQAVLDHGRAEFAEAFGLERDHGFAHEKVGSGGNRLALHFPSRPALI